MKLHEWQEQRALMHAAQAMRHAIDKGADKDEAMAAGEAVLDRIEHETRVERAVVGLVRNHALSRGEAERAVREALGHG